MKFFDFLRAEETARAARGAMLPNMRANYEELYGRVTPPSGWKPNRPSRCLDARMFAVDAAMHIGRAAFQDVTIVLRRAQEIEDHLFRPVSEVAAPEDAASDVAQPTDEENLAAYIAREDEIIARARADKAPEACMSGCGAAPHEAPAEDAPPVGDHERIRALVEQIQRCNAEISAIMEHMIVSTANGSCGSMAPVDLSINDSDKIDALLEDAHRARVLARIDRVIRNHRTDALIARFKL